MRVQGEGCGSRGGEGCGSKGRVQGEGVRVQGADPRGGAAGPPNTYRRRGMTVPTLKQPLKALKQPYADPVILESTVMCLVNTSPTTYNQYCM